MYVSDEYPWERVVVPTVLVALAGMPLRNTILGPSLGIILVISLTLFTIKRQASHDVPLGLVLVGAFLARLGLAAMDTWIGLFPKVDALGYHRGASYIATAWWQAGEVPVGSLKTGLYKLLLAPFYFTFGAHPLLARTVTAAASLVAVYNVHRIARILFDRRAALLAAVPVAFLPSIVHWHGAILREALVLVLVTQLLYLCLDAERWSPRTIPVAVAVTVLLFYFRRATLLVAAPSVAWMFLAPVILHRGGEGASILDRVRWSRVLPVSLVAVAGSGFALARFGFERLTRTVTGLGYLSLITRLGPRAIQGLRRPWIKGDATYLGDYTFDTWWHVAAFVPLGAVYFLFTPFPWQIHNWLALSALLENFTLYYPLVALAFVGIWELSPSVENLGILGFLVVGAVAFGLVEANVGTAMRHRTQFVWVFFVFAGPVLGRILDRKLWWLDGVESHE